MTSTSDRLDVAVHGPCDLPRPELHEALRRGDHRLILAARGDFVVVATHADRDVVVTSRSGLVGYYRASSPAGRLVHGASAGAVAAAAGRPVRWDHAAVADYLALGHPFGGATALAGVHRFPAGTVTEIRHAGTATEIRPPDEPDEQAKPAEPAAVPRAGEPARLGAATGAVEALLGAVAAIEDDAVLSMSGGLDSRVLLAASLALGRRPALLLSGVEGSFDRVVGTAIADRFRLPLTVVNVPAGELAAGVAEIALPTAGLLPATHWAGLAHLRGTGTAPVVHGANGEFARAYHAPPVGLAALRWARSDRASAVPLLLERHRQPFAPGELAGVAPELRAALDPAAVRERLSAALAALPGATALDVADEFFLAAHGRHKTAADLAAVGRYRPWRAPFFDPAWTGAVRALPRPWKLGSRLHRATIAGLCPGLLEFPEEGYGPGGLARRPPARYWTDGPAPDRRPHFLDQSAFRGGPLVELFRRHAGGDLVEPWLADRLADELAAGSGRPNVAFGLLALALFKNALKF